MAFHCWQRLVYLQLHTISLFCCIPILTKIIYIGCCLIKDLREAITGIHFLFGQNFLKFQFKYQGPSLCFSIHELCLLGVLTQLVPAESRLVSEFFSSELFVSTFYILQTEIIYCLSFLLCTIALISILIV